MNFRDPKLFFNRELSWLAFNRRVLEEAQDPANPPLERVKFLAIVASNLDEFFEIRVAGLIQQVAADVADPGPDGMLPEEQLEAVSREAHRLVADQYACWNNEVLPALEAADVHLRSIEGLSEPERAYLRDYCERELHPVLTPLTVNPAHPFPRIVNKALSLAVLLESSDGETYLGIVTVPRLLPRFIRLPRDETERRFDYVALGDLVCDHLPELFRGYSILNTARFRITRNSDLYLDEEEVQDLLLAIEDELKNRHKGDTVRLEIDAGAPDEIERRLREIYHLRDDQIFRVDGPVNFSRLMMLYSATARPDLKDAPYHPPDPGLGEDYASLFAEISRRDVLLHHPYDSFHPVVQFVSSAAADPTVLAIKQTLYRTSEDSPIMTALIAAAEAGKEVTVVVELKARFDEESNIRWARRLQDAGVYVVYGVVGLKTHSKLSMVVRREGGKLRRYAHLGTGNYNPSTARLYTDLGLMTAREDITSDVAEVFNLLTTQSSKPEVKKLLVAPFTMMKRLLTRIDREIKHAKAGKPARIVAKMNSLQDQRIIRALYKASQNGVDIDLIVRGICCLRPGVPGVSERIRVRSIVGRYLEHTRIFCFENGGNPEIYLGSADWMPRNLRRRVEVLFPVEDKALVRRIRSEVLSVCMADNVKARELHADGTEQRHTPKDGEQTMSSQEALMARARGEKVVIPDYFRKGRATG